MTNAKRDSAAARKKATSPRRQPSPEAPESAESPQTADSPGSPKTPPSIRSPERDTTFPDPSDGAETNQQPEAGSSRRRGRPPKRRLDDGEGARAQLGEITFATLPERVAVNGNPSRGNAPSSTPAELQSVLTTLLDALVAAAPAPGAAALLGPVPERVAEKQFGSLTQFEHEFAAAVAAAEPQAVDGAARADAAAFRRWGARLIAAQHSSLPESLRYNAQDATAAVASAPRSRASTRALRANSTGGAAAGTHQVLLPSPPLEEHGGRVPRVVLVRTAETPAAGDPGTVAAAFSGFPTVPFTGPPTAVALPAAVSVLAVKPTLSLPSSAGPRLGRVCPRWPTPRRPPVRVRTGAPLLLQGARYGWPQANGAFAPQYDCGNAQLDPHDTNALAVWREQAQELVRARISAEKRDESLREWLVNVGLDATVLLDGRDAPASATDAALRRNAALLQQLEKRQRARFGAAARPDAAGEVSDSEAALARELAENLVQLAGRGAPGALLGALGQAELPRLQAALPLEAPLYQGVLGDAPTGPAIPSVQPRPAAGVSSAAAGPGVDYINRMFPLGLNGHSNAVFPGHFPSGAPNGVPPGLGAMANGVRS